MNNILCMQESNEADCQTTWYHVVNSCYYVVFRGSRSVTWTIRMEVEREVCHP